jgi:hypothetical protein
MKSSRDAGSYLDLYVIAQAETGGAAIVVGLEYWSVATV